MNKTSFRTDRLSSPAVLFGVVGVSLIYFVDILLRSNNKLYWFDELVTDYLCQLPSSRDTWAAVMHGADFNPPLFYLLTRVSQAMCGHGAMATRMPEILGFWLFSLSLFVFTSRRAGVISGAIAGIFPFFTLAQYYAYEARPHGIVLGFCGLALICWQRAKEGRQEYSWASGFCVSLIAAALCHVYAILLVVPFAGAEFYCLLRARRAHWPTLGALFLAGIVPIPVYIPMLHAYRLQFGTVGGITTAPGTFAQEILPSLIGPALGILVIALACLATRRARVGKVDADEKQPGIPSQELFLAFLLVLLPFLGAFIVIMTRGIFYARYFLSSTAGWAILLAFAASGRRWRSWAPGMLAISMFFLLLWDCANVTRRLVRHNDFQLIEPSTKFPFVNIAQPLDGFESLTRAPQAEDILVLSELDYLYLFKYAPASITSRLYYGAVNERDPSLILLRSLAASAHLDLKTSLLVPFLHSRNKLLVYDNEGGLMQLGCSSCIGSSLAIGFSIRSVTRDRVGTLYGYEREPAQVSFADATKQDLK